MITQSSPSSHIPTLQPQEKIGDFTIRSLISVGEFGDLYSATVSKSSLPVHLYILSDYFSQVIGLKKRVSSVLEKSHQISSSRILKIKDFYQFDDQFVLCYSSIEGDLLRNKRDALTGDSSYLSLLIEVLEGLRALHEEELFIPNLSPENLLITDKKEVLLQGYGISEILGKKVFQKASNAFKTNLSDQTEINAFNVVHPDFGGSREFKPHYDLFALGHTMYWLMTGTLPSLKSYKSVTDFNLTLSQSWDDVIRGMLGLRKNHNFLTAHNLLEELKNFKTEVSSSEELESKKEIAEKKSSSKRTKRKFSSILLTLVALLGIGFGYVYFTLNTKDEVAQITEKSRYSVEIIPPNQGEGGVRVERYPSGTEILISGESTWRPLLEGSTRILVSPFPERLTVRHPNYDNFSLELSESKKDTEVVWNAPWGHFRKAVDLKTNAGAKVSLFKGDSLVTQFVADQENFERTFLFDKKEYRWVVEQEGFFPKEEVFRIEKFGKPAFDLSLSKFWAIIDLPALNKDDEVLLNGEMIDSGKNLDQVIPNETYLITIKRKGFLPVEYSIKPGAGEQVRLEAPEWLSDSGLVSFGFAPEIQPFIDELTCKINDQEKPFGSEMRLPIGQYLIEMEHPDYLSYRTELEIGSNTVTTLEIEMEPRPAQLFLKLSNDVPFRLFDENASSFLSASEEGFFTLVPNKEASLRVDIGDAYSVKRKFFPKPNEKLTFLVEVVSLPSPVIGSNYKIPYTAIDLVWIEPGQFEMGSSFKEQNRLPNEGPSYLVSFEEGFWMASAEVRQSDYRNLMKDNPSIQKGDDLPVHNISFFEAQDFVERLNVREKKAGRLPSGYRYQLPTEAKWEYAARAGTLTRFHVGDEITKDDANLLFPSDSELIGLEAQNVRPVGSYPPNDWGLFDIHGNVSEWTADHYQSRLPENYDGEWSSPDEGVYVTVRGGNYAQLPKDARSAAREKQVPDVKGISTGLRIVLVKE